MSKRLKQLVIGGAALAALTLGGSASAGAASGSGSSSTVVATRESTVKTVTGDAAPKGSAASLGSGRSGSIRAMHHVRDSWIHDLYLTDHQQYLRHHERLGSAL